MANMNWGYDEQGNRKGVPVPQLKETSWGYDPQGNRKPNPVNQDAQEAMRENRMAQINNEYSGQPAGLSTDAQEEMRDSRMRDIGQMGAYDNRDPRQVAWSGGALPTATKTPQPTDPWKAMAQQLAQYSAQRAAPQFAQQEQTPGFNTLRDRNEEDNAEKTRRWAMQDIANARDPHQAALMAQMFQHDQGNQVQLRGQDIQAGVSGRGQDIQARGQGLQAGVATRGQDVQARGQEMGLAGQFINQQATGLNQQAHDERSAKMQKELEELKQKDPKTHAMVEYYLKNADESAAKTGLYNTQQQAAQHDIDFGKSEEGLRSRHLQLLMKEGGMPYAEAKREVDKESIRRQLQAEKQGASGRVGYADGGQVESAEQLLARMKAKYGGAPSPQTEQPAPQPAPRPQAPAPQQPQTMADKLRGIATGNLERRMQGYANGGSIFADDSQGGLKARLAAMQSMNNGASVEQAYGGVPQFGEWNFDDSTNVSASGGYGSTRGLNFAQGGPIDVSGRPVHGAGTGKSDSLPAVIDDEHPAALSTGEFVMPVETVQHFGLDRLNKMVAASRKGLDTGRKPA